MISTWAIWVLLLPIKGIVKLLQAADAIFGYLIPDNVIHALNPFYYYLGYFQGIFPIDTLVACIGILIDFFILLYGVKLILWFMSWLPMIHGQLGLPTIKEEVIQTAGEHGNTNWLWKRTTTKKRR